ncbi:MAG TPA: BlaI/MecI/CopY family transcriptional regulator [Thermoplasmata archaeon]|nr:BlaI/MecI/CopY family transcriptional regulator [Thermoplasmata archaeon]HLA47200.1 BlaI/MecI/CopY family transcriptional regulator [Thermoplasmata archaeon]
MELGDLELAVLRAVRALSEATPGDIHREVRKARDVAYTSVTTTLYRLVDKDLVAMRKESEKRVFYSIKDGKAYERAMTSMMNRVVDTFGASAISYILGNPGSLSPEEIGELRRIISRTRARESPNVRAD